MRGRMRKKTVRADVHSAAATGTGTGTGTGTHTGAVIG
jgi:hypothetical protein